MSQFCSRVGAEGLLFIAWIVETGRISDGSPAKKSWPLSLGTFSRVSFEGFLVSTLKLPLSEYNEAETRN